MLNIKLNSKPVYQKYIEAKLKTLSKVANTVFSDNKIPKKSIDYVFIAAISIDSVMKIDKTNNYPQVYLEGRKYKILKKNINKLIEAELKVDNFNDSDDSNPEQSCFKFF